MAKYQKLIKPSYYTSDIRDARGVIAYVVERFGLCLVTSEEEIYLIKSRHTPKYGPYSPSELYHIPASELSDIPRLEQTLVDIASKKKTWLRTDHIKDLNRGIDYLDLDSFIKETEVFNTI